MIGFLQRKNKEGEIENSLGRLLHACGAILGGIIVLTGLFGFVYALMEYRETSHAVGLVAIGAGFTTGCVTGKAVQSYFELKK